MFCFITIAFAFDKLFLGFHTFILFWFAVQECETRQLFTLHALAFAFPLTMN